jgi:outer membrane receptor protein involved in Fe transport
LEPASPGAGRIFRAAARLDRLSKSKSDEDAWGGTLKMLWHMNDDVSLYAGVDRGFRLGGINNLGQPNYDNEIALNYEVGVKGLLPRQHAAAEREHLPHQVRRLSGRLL